MITYAPPNPALDYSLLACSVYCLILENTHADLKVSSYLNAIYGLEDDLF